MNLEPGAMAAPGTGANLEAGSQVPGAMGAGLVLGSAPKLGAHTTLLPLWGSCLSV